MTSSIAAEMGKALVIASEHSKIMEMCHLISYGVDIDFVYRYDVGMKDSTTPLIQAARFGQIDAMRLLFSRNADVNKSNDNGITPIHVSATSDTLVPLLELLLSKGARIDVRDKDGQTPLHKAAFESQKEAVICLLNHGADVNAADKKGGTCLIFSAQENCLPLVDLFLKRGADPNLADNIGGFTALHKSSFRGNFEMAECLLEGGADVNHQCQRGFTPLHVAAQEGHLKNVKLLVKKGANIHQATHQGQNPLHLASFHSRSEVVDYLIKKGADFDDQGNAVGKACKCCGATDVPVFKCAGCKVVWYCSPECQKKDWKEGGENKHKIQCPRIKEQRELYKEKKKEEVKMEAEETEKRAFQDRLMQENETDGKEINKLLSDLEKLLRRDGASSSNQG